MSSSCLPLFSNIQPVFLTAIAVGLVGIVTWCLSVGLSGTFPWEDYEQDLGYFCERDHEREYMREPANVLSTLAFWWVGFFQIFSGLRDLASKEVATIAEKFPQASFLPGVLNLYHASGTYLNHSCRCRFGHFLDVHGMLSIIYSVCCWQYLRLLEARCKRRAARLKYSIATILGFLALSSISWLRYDHELSDLVEGVGVAGLIAFALWLEYVLSRDTIYDKRLVLAGVLGLVIGFPCHNLDRSGICWSDSAFQLHAIWHLGTALTLQCFYFHFRAQSCRSDP